MSTTSWAYLVRLGFPNSRTQEMLDHFSYSFFFPFGFTEKDFCLYSFYIVDLYQIYI